MLFECVARVHNFRFTSLELIYFRSLDIRARCLLTFWPVCVKQLLSIEILFTIFCPFPAISKSAKPSSKRSKLRISYGENNHKFKRREPLKIVLSECVARVHNFRFTSLEFIYFRSLDIRARCLLRFLASVCPATVVLRNSLPISNFLHKKRSLIQTSFWV